MSDPTSNLSQSPDAAVAGDTTSAADVSTGAATDPSSGAGSSEVSTPALTEPSTGADTDQPHTAADTDDQQDVPAAGTPGDVDPDREDVDRPHATSGSIRTGIAEDTPAEGASGDTTTDRGPDYRVEADLTTPGIREADDRLARSQDELEDAKGVAAQLRGDLLPDGPEDQPGPDLPAAPSAETAAEQPRD
ncbi:hypothetical protein [Nakamurella leprariae]|uniref:Uncharacterized protein n=1 Tax=Nakamurella leprariae TaxID=2803911 RepID=A0A939BYI2_9ACTN|nr:hypothetical protein [Nakamurella leprariae]MBM9467110.1 hypothetical protein [Nakamurella leprariae]